MNQFILRPAAVKMIDGVPATKAGEWAGIKPAKFKGSKKIIHPKCSNIFSLDDSFPLRTHKKFFKPKPKENVEFKAKTRRVFSAVINKNYNNTHTHNNDLYPTPTQNYNRIVIDREYEFEKRDKYYKMIQENFNKKRKEIEIMNKTKGPAFAGGISIQGSNTNRGFDKQFFERVSSNKILGVTLTQDLYHKYRKKMEKMKKISDQGQIIKKRKINSYKVINNRKKEMALLKLKEKLEFDINYVKALDIKD